MIALFKKVKWTALLAYMILSPAAVLISMAFSMSLQPLMDAGISGDGRGFLRAALLAVMWTVLSVAASYLEEVQRMKLVNACTAQLRLEYFSGFFRQHIDHFLEEDSAVLLSRLTVDAEVVAKKYFESGLRVYHSLWSLVASILAIASARWELAVFVVVFSLLSVNLPKLFQNGANRAEQDFLDSSNRHIAQAQEGIGGYLVIRLHSLVASQTEKYGKAVRDLEQKDVARHRRLFAINELAGGISTLSYVLIIIFTVMLVLQGKLSIGYTMSVSQLLGGIMHPFEILPGYLMAYRTGRDLFRANEAKESSCVEKVGALDVSLDGRDDSIQANGVSFTYPGGTELLWEIDFSLSCRKKYALVGTSGSGKSTLSKLLMGFIPPDAGLISVAGTPVDTADKEQLYRVISYQSQRVWLFRDTIRNNILLEASVSEERWQEIMAAARLEEMLEKLPDGVDSMIEENGKNVSGGEAQRIGLARCLAKEPRFMIFDEIAASLDNQTAVDIERTVLSLRDVGVLMITHRIYEENMRRYDRILVLKGGQITEQGTWEELMERKGDFYKLAVQSGEAG